MTSSPLPVAILAGGVATRLRPVTETIPKALVDVAGEPFLAHQLRLLRRNGLERVVICAAYLGDMIEEYVRASRPEGLDVTVAYDGPRLLGTAGALRRAAPLLGSVFFVLYGDSYLPCNYNAVARAYQRSGKAALMAVYRNDGKWDRSNVEFADGEIRAHDKVHQTREMHYVDYGLGVLSQAALEPVPPDEPYDLAVLYQDLLCRGELAGYAVGERFYEVGSFSGIDELTGLLTEQALTKREQV